MPTIIQRPSPSKSGTLVPRYIMLHHTASTNFESTVRYLCRLTTPASAHFVVGKAGEIAQLVQLNKQAWHAGKGGPYRTIPRDKGNAYCIGIEIVNRGDGKDPFPEAQLKAIDWLINHLDVLLGKDLPIIDHKAYTSRKIDMRANFPLGMYQKYRRYTAPPKPEWVRGVITQATTMRAARSSKSAAIRTLGAGNVVRVYSKTSLWCYVEYGAKRGYVLTSKLRFDAEQA